MPALHVVGTEATHGAGDRRMERHRRSSSGFARAWTRAANPIRALAIIAFVCQLAVTHNLTAETAIRNRLLDWPSDSQLRCRDDAFNVVVFLHPQCPCSENVPHQLARLLSETDGKVALQIVFYCPEESSYDWSQVSAWRQAHELGTESILIDVAGNEAKRFGAIASGHCLVFDRDGNKRFSGGLGGPASLDDGPRFASLRRVLRGEPVPLQSYAVTGCAVTPPANLASYDFFTNYGQYMPRVQCLRTAEGNPDWAWIVVLMALNSIILSGYLRIFVFWRRCYLTERPEDRDNKLMQLAWMFFVCGAGSYGLATVIFFWPAYRLLAIVLFGLAIVTWRFASDLEPFQRAFTTSRLARQLNEALSREVEERRAREVELQSAKEFFQSVLDSINAHICVVDETGNIVETNAAWEQFASHNEGDSVGVGANYLTACYAATGECAEDASRIADAIEEIIAGERQAYVSEYPCHSPTQQRWYQVNASPLMSAAHGGAVIVHSSITERVQAQHELLEAQEHLELLSLVAKFTDNAVVITNERAEIEWVNDGFTRLTEYTLDDVKGRVPGAFLQGEETSPETIQIMREGINNRTGFDVEMVNYSKSGRKYWLAIEARPIEDSDGNVVKFIAIESDISARKQQEEERTRLGEALAKRTAVLDAVLESVSAGIIAVDHAGEIICFNAGARAILGRRAPANIRFCDWGDAYRLLDATNFSRLEKHQFPLNRAMGGEVVRDEELLVRRPSQDCLVSVSASPLTADEVGGGVAVLRDITEERKLEHHLRLLRAAVDNANEAMLSVTSVGVIVDVNEIACRRLGYSRETLVGMHFADIDPSLSREVWPDHWAELCESSTTWYESQHATKDGKLIPVEVSQVHVTYRGEEYACAFVRDITDRKVAQAERESLESEMLQVSRQAGMAEIATGVLHNVGNVLNSVNVSANLIQEHLRTSSVSRLESAVQIIDAHRADLATFLTTDERGRHFPKFFSELVARTREEHNLQQQEIHELVQHVEHVNSIVAMQQTYARAGGTSELVNLCDLVDDALKINDAALVRHQVEVVRDIIRGEPILTDRHKVLQILVNLVNNAKSALSECSGETKTLTVRVAADEGFQTIHVEDNGVGIPQENLTRIFSHGFTTKKDGHGFGLHHSVLSAKELGGSLSVHSDGPGQGARFTLRLPAENGAAASEAVATAEQV